MRTTLLALAGIAAGFTMPRFDETAEPPLQIELQIDGNSHHLVAGKKVELTIGGNKHVVLATVGPTRQFAAAGVAFDYPAHLGFEFDEDIASRMWTLDGNDVTAMVFELEAGEPVAMGREVLAGSLAEFDGKARPEKAEIVLGGKPSTAWSARVEVMGNAMAMSTFAVTANGKCVVVMLQDMLTDDGKLTAESERFRKMLAKSFRVAK